VSAIVNGAACAVADIVMAAAAAAVERCR
jgi:hypothetical protein